MSKSIEQRKAYLAHKSKQLDKITNPYKYGRRAERIMRYNNALMKINNEEMKRIVEGDESQ